MNKTKAELEAEIEKLEEANFYLEIKDRWSVTDFELSDKYFRQIMSLKEQIKQLEEQSK